jgi:hypothetical protein
MNISTASALSASRSAPDNVLAVLARAVDYYEEDHAPCHAQDMREARAVIAELIEASRRTIRAFEALGEAPGLLKEVQARKECEAAMVAQKEVLARVAAAEAV